MYRTKESNTGVVKTYNSYAEMIVDFGHLSKQFDVEGSMQRIPTYCFKTLDGKVHIAGNFQQMVINLKDVLGLNVNPAGSKQFLGAHIISFNEYAPAPEKEQAPVEIKPVDSPARKRATRAKKAE